jgi:hypothetical protein
VREWHPIATAPKDGTRVLVAGGTRGCEYSWCEFYGAKVKDTAVVKWDSVTEQFVDGELHYNPTHWMPLPAPPVPGEGT